MAVPTALSAAEVAYAYQGDVSATGARLAAILTSLWQRMPPGNPALMWRSQITEAVAAFYAAQATVAAMADTYLDQVVAAQGSPTAPAGEVNTDAFVGATAGGLTAEDLLSLPAQRAGDLYRGGASQSDLMSAARATLEMYARTEIADAGRASAAVAGTARGYRGYVRVLRPPSCARCAILAGRVYRYSRAFQRHPRCDCAMIACGDEIPDGLATDFRDLFDKGQVHGLSAAETQAIRLGADPSQVVNARDGMYVANGRRYTTTGTTRRGLAGMRLNALSGAQTAQSAARYVAPLSRGNTFTRVTPHGVQRAAYRVAPIARPAVATILQDASSPQAAARALFNAGYLISP